jgi:Xaa-Pro aminopeptidase
MSQRLSGLRLKMAEAGIDALLVSQQKDRRYISGFSSSAGYLIVSQDDAVLALDSRYVEWAKQEASPSSGIRILQVDGAIVKWLPDIVSGMGISNLGFDDTGITYDIYTKMHDALDSLEKKVELIATGEMVSGLRTIKDAGELELMQKAAAVADASFESMKRQLKIGMTEKEIAWLLERLLRDNGSASPPFNIIVASGTNSAFPHHANSDRAIAAGDPIIIDFGARINGYGSDTTRTLCLGDPSSKFSEIYNIVLTAQIEAIDKIESGMTGKQADAIARSVITDAGYGQYFVHALGHGTGLVVHEEPRLGEFSDHILADGMVVTIEPGIYIPGWGGVRIEDMVVLEKGKARVITHVSK